MKNVFRPLLVSVTLSAMLFSSLPVATAAEEPKAGEAPKAAETSKAPEPAPRHRPVKIGYVEMGRIAAESAPGKSALAQMKERTEKLRVQITNKQKQLEKMKKSLETKLDSLSPQQREAKAKEFQKKIEEYQKFVQNAEKEMRAKEENLTGKLIKSIEKAAAEYGKANDYAAVVPKKDLLFIGDSVEVKDLTEEIMNLVNETKGNR